jgi:hypothetical protein
VQGLREGLRETDAAAERRTRNILLVLIVGLGSITVGERRTAVCGAVAPLLLADVKTLETSSECRLRSGGVHVCIEVCLRIGTGRGVGLRKQARVVGQHRRAGSTASARSSATRLGIALRRGDAASQGSVAIREQPAGGASAHELDHWRKRRRIIEQLLRAARVSIRQAVQDGGHSLSARARASHP